MARHPSYSAERLHVALQSTHGWSESVAAPMVGPPESELEMLDPLVLNLSVVHGIPALAGLHIQDYQAAVDAWIAAFRRQLPGAMEHFCAAPKDWKGDADFFRLGMLCWYLGEVLGIRYKENQIGLASVAYTDPSDLFLNGVIDTRRGTCGNMPVLFLAIARRLGWPVSLVVAGSHVLCRYSNGAVSYNIECTNFADGFRSPPDEFLRKTYGIPIEAVQAGSDLCPLSARQMMGWFVGLRGRHHWDCARLPDAEADYRLALTLFPESQRLQANLAEIRGMAPVVRTGASSELWSRICSA